MSQRATPILLLIALALGCASRPAELDQVRADYERVAADQAVQRRAGVEIHDASLAVVRAEDEWEKQGDYDESIHLSYIASRRVELAWLAAERRTLEDEVSQFPEHLVNRVSGGQPTAASFQSGSTRVHLEPANAEALRTALEQLDAKPGERAVFTLAGVLFAFDSADLRDTSDPSLELLADFLRTHPRRSVLVEGHTDDTGALEYNFDLSRRRAESVKALLSGIGVDSDRVLTVGYGPVYPIASNTTATGRARNRRVEIVVLERESES